MKILMAVFILMMSADPITCDRSPSSSTSNTDESGAQSSPGITLNGYVFDAVSEQALKGAKVCYRVTSACARTWGNGYYSIVISSPALLTIVTTRIGYIPDTTVVDVGSDGARQNVVLQPIGR